jgi:FSR family fosmidomycin resistance protein-like MFS transporter
VRAAGFDRRALTALASGHLLADATQGVVPALLPFLVRDRGLSFAAASALVLASTISSSVVQPVFGHLSDRRPLPWLMPVGVLLGGIGVALTGLTPSYPTLVAAVLLSGLGVAAFHPEGARYVSAVSGDRRATGMSVFSLGGTAGFALGPALVTVLVVAFGLPGTIYLVLPAAAMALVLALEVPRLARLRTAATAARARGGPGVGGRDDVPAFARLAGVAIVRSFVYYGLLTFVPLYFVGVVGTSEAEGASALTVMLAGAAVGTLAGGWLADRIGRWLVLAGSMVALPPTLLVLLTLDRGPLLLAVLALAGALGVGSYTVIVVMGQELMPNRLGVASGITLGLAIGMGGVGASALGVVADAYGLEATMAAIAALPLAALALTVTLPGRPGTAGRAAAAEP